MTRTSPHSIILLAVALVLAGCLAPSATQAPAAGNVTTTPAADDGIGPVTSTIVPRPSAEATPTGPSAEPTDASPPAEPEASPTTATAPTPSSPPATTATPTAEPAPPAPARGPSAVDLRSASGFAVLSKAGISTTGTTAVVGNLGVSPIDSTAITGFGLVMDASNVYATSTLVTGSVFAADYAPPMPSQMTTAVSDMETAYHDAAGRTDPTATELGSGSIGGMTIAPGLYKWGTGVNVLSDLTLEGGPDDVWIFQIAQTLDLAPGVQVTLAGGAQAKNVFWQTGDQVTLGTTSALQGNVLSHSAIVLKTGATLDGRALAQTAVTLDASRVALPAA